MIRSPKGFETLVGAPPSLWMRVASNVFAGFRPFPLALIAPSLLISSVAQAQTIAYVRGTTNLLVGPTAGSSSVVLGVTPATVAWTNSAKSTWLHLSEANQKGKGSTNVVFTIDANPGATRTGTLTIAGETLIVTQAGSSYVAAKQVPLLSAQPYHVNYAVDDAGNVYGVDTSGPSIFKWTATNNQITTLWNGFPLFLTNNLTVDSAGNVYTCNPVTREILEWTAANSNLATLFMVIPYQPNSLAVDDAGNLYISELIGNSIQKWSPENSSNLVTLVPPEPTEPVGVAVDKAGNVYFAANGSGIAEWMAANSNVITLVPSA